jgi:hypothetical protein
LTSRHTIRHATDNPAATLPGTVMPQHLDQHRWRYYTYLVATRSA